MKLHEQQTGNANVIRAYDADSIRVNDTDCTASLVVTPETLEPGWPVSCIQDLTEDMLIRLLEYEPDIILIGTGRNHQLLDTRLMLSVMQEGVGVEVMSTDAACRTYNVLLGEDRKVLAALIIEKV